MELEAVAVAAIGQRHVAQQPVQDQPGCGFV